MARAANSAFPRFTTYTPYIAERGITPPINQHFMDYFAKATPMNWRRHNVGAVAAGVAGQTEGTGNSDLVAAMTQHRPIMQGAQQQANEFTDRERSEDKRRNENAARRLGYDDANFRDDPALPTTGARPGNPVDLTFQQRQAMGAQLGGAVAPQTVPNFAHKGVQTVDPSTIVTHASVQSAMDRTIQNVQTSPIFGTQTLHVVQDGRGGKTRRR